MLQHRLSKFGSAALVALCLLFTGSFMQSCNDELFDDYKYDDEYPAWLGASIYEFLKGEHADGRTYNNYIAIIDSLGYGDILARTGSKTLFVADDAAFDKFFASDNRWGVTRFEDLTKAQMRILLYSAMLDNMYLIDMMSSLPGNPPVEGSCLRRVTSLQAVDSVPYFTPEMLPTNNKYWDRFRAEAGGTGLRLGLDGTDPMMVHFLREFMKSKVITSDDVNVIFNADRNTQRSGDEAFIYQNQVLASGVDYGEISDDTLTITCKNGYVYRMDGVLVPPSNMAEELRNHPSTKIFSHLLDRFSLPVYSAALSESYNYVNNNTDSPDSVFVMRYLNKSSARPIHGLMEDQITAKTSGGDEAAMLSFDPGWNQYALTQGNEQGDMAGLLVPNDAQVYNYFARGAGEFLVELYAPNVQLDKDSVVGELPVEKRDLMIQALDSIPNKIIASFINNLMLPSFSNSVPSKFDQVYNDGSELMFNEFKGRESSVVEECVVANNGVIYILNHVFGPAEYRSVSAPPLAMTNMTIMKSAIDNLGYNSYLLAMDAVYSFIVPDDNYFVYYDPVTKKSMNPVAFQFFYNNKYKSGTNVPVKLWAKVMQYDPTTYEIVDDSIAPYAVEGSGVKFPLGDGSGRTASLSNGWSDGNLFYNRLTDLLEYLIIVGNVEDGNQYYQSKGYGSIKCKVVSTNPENLDIKFYGGEQLENGLSIKVAARYEQDNGVTYCTESESGDSLTSGIPTPPTESVSYKLDPLTSVNSNFDKFYELCYGDDEMPLNDISAPSEDDTLGGTQGGFFYNLYPNLKTAELTDTAQRYSIFYGTTSKQKGSNVPMYEAVPFFSTYHYTVYVPTNDAMDAVYAKGLPTWSELIEELSDTTKRGKVASYVRLINKFVRYHFQDNAVYVDTKDFEINNAGTMVNTANYETAAIDDVTGRFFEIKVQSVDGVGGRTLGITDNMGKNIKVVNTAGQEGKSWNVMTRDLLVKCQGANNSQLAHTIETSSFAVVHQVDQALLNSGVIGYDGNIRRFVDGGELVDTMTVVGGSGSVLTGYGADCYLVGRVSDIVVTDTEGNESYKCVAYLVKPTGDNGKLNKDEYVLDSNGEKILINNDGYRVKEVIKTNSKGQIVSIEYKFVDANGSTTYTDEAGEEVEYTEGQVRYNNLGVVIQ